MHQLIYASVATSDLGDEELKALLEKARKENERSNVTGLLLYRGDAFIQVLEGEEAVVDELYQRIREDRRHTDVVLLRKAPIEEREFGEWSMGFRTVNAADMKEIEGYSSFLEENTVQQLRRLASQPSFAYEALLKFKSSS